MSMKFNDRRDQIELLNLYCSILFQQITSTMLAYNESLVDSEVVGSMKKNVIELYEGIQTFVWENNLKDSIKKVENYNYIQQIIWEWKNNLK